MRPQSTAKDMFLALAITLLGGLFLFLALRGRYNPQDVNPGIDGCLTAGVVGTILLLLHPLAYRHAMLFTAPLIAVEYWACVAAGGPAFAVVGLHMIIVGFIGLGLALREPRPVAPRARASAHRAAVAQHA